MSATDYKFEGWLGHDPSSAKGNMKWGEFEPKPWEETDVDIKITHCGICGSDLHTLRSGWVSKYVLGHGMNGTNSWWSSDTHIRALRCIPAASATKSSAPW